MSAYRTLPIMTKPKHWLGLFYILTVEAILAFICFQAGPPASYIGLALVILGNIKLIGAVVLRLVNVLKKK